MEANKKKEKALRRCGKQREGRPPRKSRVQQDEEESDEVRIKGNSQKRHGRRKHGEYRQHRLETLRISGDDSCDDINDDNAGDLVWSDEDSVRPGVVRVSRRTSDDPGDADDGLVSEHDVEQGDTGGNEEEEQPVIIAELAPEDRDIELITKERDELQQRLQRQPVLEEAEIVEQPSHSRRLLAASVVILLVILSITIPIAKTMSDKTPTLGVLLTVSPTISSAPSLLPSTAPTIPDIFEPPSIQECMAIYGGEGPRKRRENVTAFGFVVEMDAYVTTDDAGLSSFDAELLMDLQTRVAPLIARCGENDIINIDRQLLSMQVRETNRKIHRDMQQDDNTEPNEKRSVVQIANVEFDGLSLREDSCNENGPGIKCLPILAELLVFVKGNQRLLHSDIDVILLRALRGIVVDSIRELRFINMYQISVFECADAVVISTPSPTSSPIDYSDAPSDTPSESPTGGGGGACCYCTSRPSTTPSPTASPSVSISPSVSTRPSSTPSQNPSAQPSARPSAQPSLDPSSQPSARPSDRPSLKPSQHPSAQPTVDPESGDTMGLFYAKCY